ncbi:hypothetical protein AK830_g9553 [Neonectria ditissima]|uniref:Bacteriophage T5 Orf172 DNA-binding domain-containing protein n=1 Tax=Neonectria ditissima TaxID=78410 RepID=A0A0P7ARS7_9HYPO|nr:hypothetical protein AK830_g9553 [Neonectria ditissima]
MSLPVSLPVWPATSSTLRDLLSLDSAPRLHCIGQTKAERQCRKKGSGKTAIQVSSLLEQIVTSGGLVAARSLLTQVSHLVFCYHHIDARPSYLESWEKKLESCRAATVKVEDKDEESTVQSTRRLSSDQQGKVKKEAPETKTFEKTNTRASNTSPSKSLAQKSPKSVPPKQIAHKFEPYGDPLSIEKRNNHVKCLVLRQLLPTERSSEGCIYVYTFPENYHDAAPYLKIGNAKHLDSRMAAWKRQCAYKPEVLSDFRSELYVKVERLVHAQLRNERIREAGGCPRCQVKHHEWFKVGSSKACGVLGLWTAWTRQKPYDESGELKEEWRARAERLDMSDPGCWEKFVDWEHEDEDESDYDEDIESGFSEADSSELSSEYEYDSPSSDDDDYE